MKIYNQTREFTGGNLKGLCYTCTTGVYMPVGTRVDNPVGGSPYIIVACVEVK